MSFFLWMLAGAWAGELPDIPVPEMNAQTWRAPADAATTLWADDSTVGPDGFTSVRLYSSYLNAPLMVEWSDGGEDHSARLISDVVQMNLVGGYAYRGVRLALDVPMYVMAGSDLPDRSGRGLGDMALDFKGTILDRQTAPLGLAAGLRLTLPTHGGALPLGHSGAGGELQVIADRRLGPVFTTVNLGHRFLPRTDVGEEQVGDQFFFRVGVSYPLSTDLALSADLAGQTQYGTSALGFPVEFLLGAHTRVLPDMTLRAGLGTALVRGSGAAAVRGVLSVSWAPPQPRWGSRATAHPHITIVDPEGEPLEAVSSVLNGQNGFRQVGDGELQVRVPPGVYALTAQADGFLPLATRLEIERGASEHVLTMRHDVPYGALALRIVDAQGEDLSGAVRVDEGLWQPFRGGSTELSLYPDTYHITVRLEDGDELSLDVEFVSGKREEIRLVFD